MGLVLTVAGWAAFGLVAALAIRAWQALLARGEAVARACHEVRGPLAAVRLGLESPLLSVSGPHLRAIEVELARATVALDELQGREAASAEAGVSELVDVRMWLENSVEAWRPVALACGMEITLRWRGGNGSVWGRQSRLAQVTGNLIANAIDHGGGHIEVRGSVLQRSVVVEVVNGGPGLEGPPPALLDYMGRDRGRLRRRGREWGRRRPHDRGRGLSIARAVTEAHGGRLTTAPSTRGARFVLTLPLAGE